MDKVGDISLLFYLAGANFWAILGHFGSFLVILRPFFVLILFGQKYIFITFSISEIMITYLDQISDINENHLALKVWLLPQHATLTGDGDCLSR